MKHIKRFFTHTSFGAFLLLLIIVLVFAIVPISQASLNRQRIESAIDAVAAKGHTVTSVSPIEECGRYSAVCRVQSVFIVTETSAFECFVTGNAPACVERKG